MPGKLFFILMCIINSWESYVGKEEKVKFDRGFAELMDVLENEKFCGMPLYLPMHELELTGAALAAYSGYLNKEQVVMELYTKFPKYIESIHKLTRLIFANLEPDRLNPEMQKFVKWHRQLMENIEKKNGQVKVPMDDEQEIMDFTKLLYVLFTGQIDRNDFLEEASETFPGYELSMSWVAGQPTKKTYH